MRKRFLSLLVENNTGVLSRVAGLFTRRGYNIDSLSVSETQDPAISRMTIAVTCQDETMEQIKKQLHKLIEVIKINEFSPENAILHELVFVRLNTTDSDRSKLVEIANLFRARVVEVRPTSLTIELTGDANKVEGFLECVRPFNIAELIRSGHTGIERGK